MRDMDQYKAIGNANGQHGLDTENQTQYFGFSTPWNYIDFNQYSVHFSPRDWQQLVNNYSRWRPRAVHVKIFNLQVIQKTVTDSGTQYSNDLTGTIQIFADQEGRYPRLLYPNQTTLMGPFPSNIYYLPQYAYMTSMFNSGGPTVSSWWGFPTRESAFYCLDESPSQMLRTGNEWETTLSFHRVHNGVTIKYQPCPLHKDKTHYTIHGTSMAEATTLKGAISVLGEAHGIQGLTFT